MKNKHSYLATSNDCAFCNLVFNWDPGPDLLKDELFGNVAAVNIINKICNKILNILSL